MLKKTLKNIYENFLFNICWYGYKIGNYRIYIHNRQFWNVTLNEVKHFSIGPFKFIREKNES